MNTLESYFINNPENVIDECAKFVIDNTGSPFALPEIMQIGVTYAFSFWVKSESDSSIKVDDVVFNTNTTWQKHNIVMSATSNDLRIMFLNTGVYYIYHPKLEIGNMHTDWSPSPEDMQDNLELTLGNYYTKTETDSMFSVREDAISLLVDTRIESVKVGGRNLLLDSKQNISTDAYTVKDFYFGDSAPVDNETYTLTIKGQLGEDRTYFSVYNSGYSVKFNDLVDNNDGTYSATSKWIIKNSSGTVTADNTFLRVCQSPENATKTSTIEWIKLERGNKSTDWSPAPEDMVSSDDISNTNDRIQEIHEIVSGLVIDSNGIKAEVSSFDLVVDELTEDIVTIESELSSMQMESDELSLRFQNLSDNGVAKVMTETGFTFDSDGMTIDSTDSPTKTQVTPDGMTVYKKDAAGAQDEVLEATSEGVDATNLHAKTYLIIGGRSRFENYGTNRTGCFWIGG